MIFFPHYVVIALLACAIWRERKFVLLEVPHSAGGTTGGKSYYDFRADAPDGAGDWSPCPERRGLPQTVGTRTA